MKYLVVCVALLAACDSGDGGSGPVADAAMDASVIDARPVDSAVDMALPPDAAPDAEVDMGPGPDAMVRRPVGLDAPRVRECPARPRAPQVVLTAATGTVETQFDGELRVGAVGAGTVSLLAAGGQIDLRIPLEAAPALVPNTPFQALFRRRSQGFTEWLLVLRNPENQIVFAAGTGTSWMVQQFTQRAAVGEDVTLAGGCAEAGEQCFDRVDREVIFAGGNRRRALLPGTRSDFTTDGGSFTLAVDQAYQVACDVLCPNVATQWFSFWLLRDTPRDGVDSDGDGVLDGEDLCPYLADPGQADGDGDAIGDACDGLPDDPTPPAACAHPFDCASLTCLDSGRCQGGVALVAGAAEVCDGVDNDGDGAIDEELAGCDAATFCSVTAEITGESLVRGSRTAVLHAVPRLVGPCAGVQVTRLAWDVRGDGRPEGEGDTLSLPRLRSSEPVPVLLRLEDSRGGATVVPARIPVETSEYCP